MPYQFNTNPFIEEPFFHEMALFLNGVDRKRTFNNHKIYTKCQCPSCGRNEGALYMSQNHDTFLFKCPRDKCSLKTLTLHQLIMSYGHQKIQDEWRSARWIKIEPYNWKGIKNRRRK